MTARILIVDDVPANTRLLEAKLAAEYYQVESARDGFEALRVAAEWQPDLILLDVMMPSMDGYECCRRLKLDPATVHIPVVMVTALGEPNERVQGIEAGADDFLTKPIEYETLMARTRGLVRLKRLLDEWRARGETARSLGLTPRDPSPPEVTGAHVMIVDDWDLGAQIVLDAMRHEGIVCTRTKSTAEAIRLCDVTPFDLIILSLSIIDDDPLRFLAQLRAADISHETPLLLVADPDEREQLLRAFTLGANDWLMLPIEVHELRARARNQIRRKLYQDRLRSDLGNAVEMAFTDPLTGLYNRRYLTRHLRLLVENARASSLAILMIDVDHFKAVNDRFGHSAGDSALRLIADTLRQCTRAFDSLSRYGGEEFVVVMPGGTPDEAISTAERLRSAVESVLFVPYHDHQVKLTISVGVACSDTFSASPEILLRSADSALYRAKQAGRNRVSLATML